jgi:hypothetical protein
LNYDSEEDKKRKEKYPKQHEDRKRARQKEYEDDEYERKKELIEEEERRQAEERKRLSAEIAAPVFDIIPKGNEEDEESDSDDDFDEEMPQPSKPKAEPKYTFQELKEEAPQPSQPSGISAGLSIKFNTKDSKWSTKSALQVEEDEPKANEAEEALKRGKFKLTHKMQAPVEFKQNVVQIDNDSKQATIQFGVTQLVP